ncbi:MAG: hypothetical protein WCR66_11985 [Bacteroidota bacterium]
MKYILAIVVLAILYASNPNLDEHQRSVKDKVSQLIRREVSSSGKSSSSYGDIGTELGVMFGSSLVDGIITDVVRRKDYFFFSLTSVEYNGNNKIIGIGILGKVFISDEVDKELNKGTEKVKSVWNDLTKPSHENPISNNTIDTNIATDNSNPSSSTSSASSEYYVNASESNQVHFYSSPNYNSMRNSYFNSREKVTALRIENGFAYIEFINTDNQSSKGWISLTDLTPITTY